MRDLTVRLDALDPEAGAALRVIAYFDDLVANKAGVQAIVRGAMALAGCPAALVDDSRHVRVRVAPGGAAGPPGPRDPQWPSVQVGPEGELWLERDDGPHPADAMVLERAANALASGWQRTPHGADSHEQDLAVLLDPAGSAQDRARAARRLQLPTGRPLRAVAAEGGRMAVEPADRPEPVERRAGIGPAGSLNELPGSAAAARLALRLTAAGAAQDPGPRIVHADRAGGLLVLAAAIGPETPRHADVVVLERSASGTPWLLETLTAVADAPSLRAAAGALHVHHSTLQERLAHAERMLGWTFADPAGRLRLQLALVLRRLHRAVADS